MTPAGELAFLRQQAETIMKMSLDTKRAVVTEPVPGEETSTWPEDPYLSDYPCYAWNRRAPGVLIEPVMEIEELEWRIVVPEPSDISTEDLITAIWETDGTLKEDVAYPLRITRIQPRRSHILLTAKEQR